ncbi:MAG: metal-sulfur cluster assembly factor [Longimicrobiales bacterium]|nr:metal-sulfur cluster assembly factor [Longimicrobiales bacterium]
MTDRGGRPDGAGRTRFDDGLPLGVASHKSGGRDLWSAPLSTPPADPVAAARACLREVLDPELPISLIDLGLIYGIEVEEGVVTIRLTYTATACPCMEFIREDVRDRLLDESAWVDRVEIAEVWDPPWSVERITPEGRRRLKALGVGT